MVIHTTPNLNLSLKCQLIRKTDFLSYFYSLLDFNQNQKYLILFSLLKLLFNLWDRYLRNALLVFVESPFLPFELF